MPGQRSELLRRTAALAALSTETIEWLLARTTTVTRLPGEVFFHESDPGNSFYVLESGRAVIRRQWQDEAVQLGELGPGDCFGEMALIDMQPRSATVSAINRSVAIEVPSAVMRELCRHDIQQYAIIMMNLGREVSRRLRRSDRRLFEILQRCGGPEVLQVVEVLDGEQELPAV